jgi:hypothetical protein
MFDALSSGLGGYLSIQGVEFLVHLSDHVLPSLLSTPAIPEQPLQNPGLSKRGNRENVRFNLHRFSNPPGIFNDNFP